jgi:PAS domain S-box-containing protein
MTDDASEATSSLDAEKAADAERRMLAAAVEATAETVVLTDEAGMILYVNRAFERVTGYTRAEAVGQSSRLLSSGRQGPEFYREMWATLGAGLPWRGELVNRRKDGELFTEEASITRVDAEGLGRFYVAVKHEIEREIEPEP